MSLPSKSINFISDCPFAISTVKNFYAGHISSGFGVKKRLVISNTLIPSNSIIVISFNRSLSSDVSELFKTVDLNLNFSKWYNNNILTDSDRIPMVKNVSSKSILEASLVTDFNSSEASRLIREFDSSYSLLQTSFVNFLIAPGVDTYSDIASRFHSLELFISFMEKGIDLSFNSSINEKLSLPTARENLSLLSFLLLGVDSTLFPIALTKLFIDY